MSKSFEAAAAHARARREAVLETLVAMRERLSPPQLAEDALSLIDPELSLLGRIKERVHQNRLLSLAILAGAGWLAGAPRRHKSCPPQARSAASTTTQRANTKEKQDDSG